MINKNTNKGDRMTNFNSIGDQFDEIIFMLREDGFTDFTQAMENALNVYANGRTEDCAVIVARFYGMLNLSGVDGIYLELLMKLRDLYENMMDTAMKQRFCNAAFSILGKKRRSAEEELTSQGFSIPEAAEIVSCFTSGPDTRVDGTTADIIRVMISTRELTKKLEAVV